MKIVRLAFAVMAFGTAACGTGSHVADVPPELRVNVPHVPAIGDRHSSNRLEGIAAGAWVRYRIVEGGRERRITLAAVRAEPDAVWIEVVDEGDPRRVSQRRVSFDGQVTRARYREVHASGPASAVFDQPVAPAGRERIESSADEIVPTPERLEISGQSLDGTLVRKLFREEDTGRERREEEAWSPVVPPLLEGSEWGGLVRRAASGRTIELVEFGTHYTPLIEP